MTNPIVRISVTQQTAPVPSTAQKIGAIISQGGSNLAAGAKALLTQLSDLTPLLAAPIALASLTASGVLATATLESSTIASGTYNSSTGLVNLTLVASIGIAPGDLVAVSGVTGTGGFAALDGTFPAAVGSGGTTLEFFVATGLTMTISGGNVAATTGLATNSTFLTKIAGAAPSGYNGTFIATVTGISTFTYPVAAGLSSPATGTPTMTPPSAGELFEQATTFFNQGAGQAVYVLELGAGTPTQAVAVLSAYITANPNAFYSYLVPRNWDAVSAFLTLLVGFEALTSRTYFFVTTTVANYALYAAIKCVAALIEAPGIQGTEFTIAAAFRVTLNYSPSPTNRVTPLNFAFLFGVTPYPTSGNAALLATLNTANVWVAGTGAQGGISGTILIGGNMMDGRPFNYWYSVDWAQINGQRDVTAAAINGSNNPQNPLYYNQDGINTLQQVLVSTMTQGIADGLVLNPIKVTTLSGADLVAAIDAGTLNGYTVINAQPFASYVKDNPNDYAAGIYNGLSVDYVPLRGFASINFNITVSDFAG